MQDHPLRSALGAALAVVVFGCGAASPPDGSEVPDDLSGPLTRESLRAFFHANDEVEGVRRLVERLSELDADALPVIRDAIELVSYHQISAPEYELLVDFWASHEPYAAAEYAVSAAPRAYQGSAMHSAIRAAAARDPEGTVARFDDWEWERNPDRDASLVAVARGWLESGQPGLERYLLGLPKRKRLRLVGVLAHQKLRDGGADTVRAWASQERERAGYKGYVAEVQLQAAYALAAVDPAEAARFSDAHATDSPLDNALRAHIAERWVRTDPEAAMEWAIGHPEGIVGTSLLLTTYAAWGLHERPAAVAWMHERLVDGRPPERLDALFQTFARLIAFGDPLEGLEWAAKLDPDQQEWATLEIVREWRERDADAAEAWLADSPLSAEQRENVIATSTPNSISAIVPRETPPESSIEYLEILKHVLDPDPVSRLHAHAELLPTLDASSVMVVREVLDHAADGVIELSPGDVELLTRHWGLHEPSAALYYAVVRAPLPSRIATAVNVVRDWAVRDPQPALAFSSRWILPGGDFTSAVHHGLIRGWYASGEPGLPDYVRDLGVTFERQRALRIYTEELALDQGGDAVIAWVDSLHDSTDDAYLLEVHRKAGGSIAKYDAEAAPRYCEEHCDCEYGGDIRTSIAGEWGRIDPTAALDWLIASPSSNDRTSAVREVYQAWMRSDLDTALRWTRERIAAESSEDFPDWMRGGVWVYATRLGEEEPLEALELAARLSGDEREQLTVTLARRWHRRDPARANEWLESSGLSADAKRRVLEQSREQSTRQR